MIIIDVLENTNNFAYLWYLPNPFLIVRSSTHAFLIVRSFIVSCRRSTIGEAVRLVSVGSHLCYDSAYFIRVWDVGDAVSIKRNS